MSFNNGRERRKFEDEWRKLRVAYQQAGLSEESIEAMRAFAEDAYRSRRRFEEHTQPLPTEDFVDEDSEDRTTLFQKFESLVISFDENDFTGRYAWMDSIENIGLASRLNELKESDLELLTLLVIDGYNQVEIAAFQKCSQVAVSKRISRIKKILRQGL
jgi:DNA-directed RNA polymerase specialized sigma24 family protein